MLTKKELRRENKFNKLQAFNQLLPDTSGKDMEAEFADEPPQAKKVKFTEEQYKEVKKELNEKVQKLKRHKPKLTLKEAGELASLERQVDERTPIFVEDIEHLVKSLYLGCNSSGLNSWRWCHVQKYRKVSHTTVVLVSGLDAYQYQSRESLFLNCQQIFPVKLAVLLSKTDHTPLFLNIPLKNEVDLDDKTQLPEMQSIFPIVDLTEETDLPEGDAFSRTKLLLSPLQMVDEGFPLPLVGELRNKYKDFSMTKFKYRPCTSKSPMFALDCEMCRTSLGINEITRISIVDENCKSVYETFVKPENQIVDYMTAYSGITAKMLENVTKTLEQVHNDVKTLLPDDAILVGQSLSVDLNCMKIMHPYVIDTSVAYNIVGERRMKSKLRTLAKEFLGENIQDISRRGHDSIEDSSACMKLIKLKLSKSVEYGDLVLINQSRVQKTREPVTKKSQIVFSSSCSFNFQNFITEITKNSETCKNVTTSLEDNNDGALLRTADNALQFDLNVCCVEVSDPKKDKTISEFDEKISKIYEQVAPNGCLIVILGGSSDKRDIGAALLCIKK